MKHWYNTQGLDQDWIEKIENNRIFIKSKFQTSIDRKFIRSQSFRQKASVELWALGKPIPEEDKTKIEYFEFKDNKVFAIDSTNRVTPIITVGRYDTLETG